MNVKFVGSSTDVIGTVTTNVAAIRSPLFPVMEETVRGIILDPTEGAPLRHLVSHPLH